MWPKVTCWCTVLPPMSVLFLKKNAAVLEPSLVLQRNVTVPPVITGSAGISRISGQSKEGRDRMTHKTQVVITPMTRCHFRNWLGFRSLSLFTRTLKRRTLEKTRKRLNWFMSKATAETACVPGGTTVMLTDSLVRPSLVSHQYSPESDGDKPVCLWAVHGSVCPPVVLLILCPPWSQLIYRTSLLKNCWRLGRTVRDTERHPPRRQLGRQTKTDTVTDDQSSASAHLLKQFVQTAVP